MNNVNGHIFQRFVKFDQKLSLESLGKPWTSLKIGFTALWPRRVRKIMYINVSPGKRNFEGPNMPSKIDISIAE